MTNGRWQRSLRPTGSFWPLNLASSRTCSENISGILCWCIAIKEIALSALGFPKHLIIRACGNPMRDFEPDFTASTKSPSLAPFAFSFKTRHSLPDLSIGTIFPIAPFKR